MNYIMALDQGTTSSRSLLIDRDGKIRNMAQREFTQHYPQEQWVEHDAMEIWNCQKDMMLGVLKKEGCSLNSVAGIGITNQKRNDCCLG